MIVQLTYNGDVQNLDTDIVLYGYNNSGLNILINQVGIAYNPNASVFEANALQAISTPSYGTFVSATVSAGFFEADHATLTTICVNANRIVRLEEIDRSNSTIYFNTNQSVNVVETIATLITLINVAHGGGGGGGSTYTIVSINFASSPYTVVPTTGTTLYQVDCTGGNVIINLPTAIGSTAVWGVKKIDSTSNTITLEPFGAQTIDGNANQTILFQNTQVDIYSDNANLFIK